jgi:hypothetical protein
MLGSKVTSNYTHIGVLQSYDISICCNTTTNTTTTTTNSIKKNTINNDNKKYVIIIKILKHFDNNTRSDNSSNNKYKQIIISSLSSSLTSLISIYKTVSSSFIVITMTSLLIATLKLIILFSLLVIMSLLRLRYYYYYYYHHHHHDYCYYYYHYNRLSSLTFKIYIDNRRCCTVNLSNIYADVAYIWDNSNSNTTIKNSSRNDNKSNNQSLLSIKFIKQIYLRFGFDMKFSCRQNIRCTINNASGIIPIWGSSISSSSSISSISKSNNVLSINIRSVKMYIADTTEPIPSSLYMFLNDLSSSTVLSWNKTICSNLSVHLPALNSLGVKPS